MRQANTTGDAFPEGRQLYRAASTLQRLRVSRRCVVPTRNTRLNALCYTTHNNPDLRGNADMMNYMNEFEPADDICSDVHLAACLDIKYSDLRWTMLNDPGRLPKPFWLTRRPSWPWAQLQAWLAAGQPRDFDLPPSDFMPAPFTAFDKGRPDDLYAEWASLDASLGT